MGFTSSFRFWILTAHASSNLTMSASTSRTVTKVVLSVEQDEGVGAKVRRSIGRHEVRLTEI